ncbi:MAG: nicotinamide-nucleotide amidohydrolase family protein [Streptomycetaceae bacterium]|nr:MAG: nicotinamide-nucleotide amidohydrolase family protein [Streptomycetaceae bacterium]
MALSAEIIELAQQIVNTLRERSETLSTAESLTAGDLSSAIVTIAGASDVFVGGVTAYRDEIKISHLGVDPRLIAAHSSISEQVAVAMARGAQKSFGTTWAISTTGVAGPNPLDGHPVGTVWVAIEGPISQSIELALSGERDSVRNAATASAIASFARILRARS